MDSRKQQKRFYSALRRLRMNPENRTHKRQCWQAWCDGVPDQYVNKQVRSMLGSRSLSTQIAGVIIAGFHRESYNVFDKDVFNILVNMVNRKTNIRLLARILDEFSFCEDLHDDIWPSFSWIVEHSSPLARYSFVLATLGHDSPVVEECLLKLMKDKVINVRDWATFSVGTINNMDSEAIRNALIENADDSDEDVRHEAICGMARLKMPEVSAFIIREIENYTESNLIYESMAVFPQAEYYEVLKPLMDDKCGSDWGNGKICKCCLAKRDAWKAVNELMKESGETCVVQKSTGE